MGKFHCEVDFAASKPDPRIGVSCVLPINNNPLGASRPVIGYRHPMIFRLVCPPSIRYAGQWVCLYQLFSMENRSVQLACMYGSLTDYFCVISVTLASRGLLRFTQSKSLLIGQKVQLS